VVGSLAACRRRKNEAIGAAPMSGRFRLCKTSARPLRSATPACRFRQTAADDGLAGWGLLAAFEEHPRELKSLIHVRHQVPLPPAGMGRLLISLTAQYRVACMPCVSV